MDLALERKHRLDKTHKLMQEMNVSTLLITPGPNLRYLVGYKAKNLERLTCLVLNIDQSPRILVPKLEKLATQDAKVEDLGVEIVTWDETEDAYNKLNKLTKNIAVDSSMNATKLLKFQSVANNANFVDANVIMDSIRIIKSEYEINELKLAGKLIDKVHAQIKDLVVVGETEKQLASKIANLILESGHESVDFTIVATGRNSSSPHHEPSDSIIQHNDVLVIDIGGTLESGYCSDSTRTYVVGEPQKEFLKSYEILKNAQEKAVASVSCDYTADELDNVSRKHLKDNGLGDFFIHRTGHGIGMETHEHPYIVQGNKQRITSGMAFSIEPGFYIEGLYGSRIEDIVIKTDKGVINCNNQTKELVII